MDTTPTPGRRAARLRLAQPSEADIALARLSRTDTSDGGFARRAFLQGSLAVGGAAGLALAPGIFDGLAAAATPLPTASRILVTVFLNGGNDHLNTLVPAESGAYHDARGSLAVTVDGSTAVGEGLHLHPNLTRLGARYNAGQVALIRGVGEASDDRSHFTSMATWMTGVQNLLPPTGWLGRYQDGAGLGELGAVSVGWGGVPLTLRGGFSSAVALPPNGSLFGSERGEQWRRDGFDVFADLGGTNAGNGVFGPYVANAFASAVRTAEAISPAFTDGLPERDLARDLGLAAEVINLNLGTQLLNVNQGGYDTHDGQRPEHDDLLAELDAGIEAFFSRLHPQFAARTSVLVFSEFGRRVQQNSSGTDHGTAGMMMLIGPGIKGGLHGVQPSLTNLDDRGDMHHHLDFRQVYASVLEGWLDADATQVLGAGYSQLDLFGAPEGVFLDVRGGEYYAEAVAWLADTGITRGTTATTFSPHDPVTRGQMATFLHRYNGEPGGSPRNPFADVPRRQYYAPSVDWLATQGITAGTSATTFSPDDVVTRAQMATFLWRMEGSPNAPAAGFGDVPRGSYFSRAVDWLLHRGITTGTSPTTFSPNGAVTRAQMAAFLYRLAGRPG